MNVEWCDFVVYSNNEILIDRIIADYDYLVRHWTDFMFNTLYQKFFLVKYLWKSMALSSNFNCIT